MKNEKKYFQTSYFYLAVFLLSKGLRLINIDKTVDPKRAQFVFEDSPERTKFVESFNYSDKNSPDALVDARLFITSVKELKERLYQEDF